MVNIRHYNERILVKQQAIPELRTELGRVSNSNQSINLKITLRLAICPSLMLFGRTETKLCTLSKLEIVSPFFKQINIFCP